MAGVSGGVGVVVTGVSVGVDVCGGTEGLGGMVPAQADKANAPALARALVRPIFKFIALLVRVMPEVTLFKKSKVTSESGLVGFVKFPVGIIARNMAREGPHIMRFDRIRKRTGNDVAIFVAGNSCDIGIESHRDTGKAA